MVSIRMNPTEQRSKHKIDRTVPGLTRKERSLRDITKVDAGGKTQRILYLVCVPFALTQRKLNIILISLFSTSISSEV